MTTSWLQTCSESGRLTSENPNMQCVPKPQTYMMGSSEQRGIVGTPLVVNLRSLALLYSPILIPAKDPSASLAWKGGRVGLLATRGGSG